MDIAAFSKAIAGGIAAAIVAILARYGFKTDMPTAGAISVIVTGLVGYGVGHAVVFFAPRNKDVQVVPPVVPGDTHGL